MFPDIIFAPPGHDDPDGGRLAALFGRLILAGVMGNPGDEAGVLDQSGASTESVHRWHHATRKSFSGTITKTVRIATSF